ALGPRPAARTAPAARTLGETPDQRNGGFLRLTRPRPPRAWAARRHQPDRLRRPAALSAGARQRSSRRRPPLRTAGRRLRHHLLGGNADVRKGRAYRRAAGAARARGARVVGLSRNPGARANRIMRADQRLPLSATYSRRP